MDPFTETDRVKLEQLKSLQSQESRIGVIVSKIEAIPQFLMRFDKIFNFKEGENFEEIKSFKYSAINLKDDYWRFVDKVLNTIEWQRDLQPSNLLLKGSDVNNMIQQALDEINAIYNRFIDLNNQVDQNIKYLLPIGYLENSMPEDLNEWVEEINLERSKYLTDIENKKAELEAKVNQTLDDIQIRTSNTLQKEIVLKDYDNEFKSFSTKFSNYSLYWLVAIITLLIIFACLLGIFFTLPVPEDLTNAQAIESSALRIVLFSLNSWAIFFCSRNYSVNRNLEYIYKQKEVMAKVFFKFVDSISNPDDRSRLSVELAKILFEVYQTGLIKNTGGTDDSSPSIVQTFLDKIPKV